MKISKEKLAAEAELTGFRAEVFGKVIHLLSLLDGFRVHPCLKHRLVLKGGTALNLFSFNLPRLSVYIDLNYFGKWLLRYESALGQGGNLQVDLNFMFRIPLWPVMNLNSHSVGSYQVAGIPVLDIHELAAGKLCALLARQQGRDLFDSHQLLYHAGLEQKRLRLAFVVYGAMNRKDWRTASLQDVDSSADELKRQLLPLLRIRSAEGDESPESYGKQLVKECCDRLSVVLPFTDSEMEFLNLLLDKGEIVPSLLTSDKDLQERISRQPLLEWKALNVREHMAKD
jgi:hypothetical protein